MAKIIIYKCDSCNKEVHKKKDADNYSQCNGANIKIKVDIRGFVNDGMSIGFDTKEKDLFLCKACVRTVINNIQFNEVMEILECANV